MNRGTLLKLEEDEALEEIKNYEVSDQTRLEFEGREKTLEFLKIKNLIKECNNVKIKVKADGPTAAYKIVDGTVVFKNKNFIVVKTQYYPESFKYVDFYTGRAVIL